MFRHDENKYQAVLFVLIPDALPKIVSWHSSLVGEQKLNLLISLPQQFGEEDRMRIEHRIVRRTNLIERSTSK